MSDFLVLSILRISITVIENENFFEKDLLI